MYTKRVFCVAAVGALFASGVDARALLQEDPVDVSPSELVCTSCKQAVAQGEAFVNDDTLEKLDKKIKKLCADKGDEAEMVRPPHETRPRTRAARPARAPTPDAPRPPVSSDLARVFDDSRSPRPAPNPVRASHGRRRRLRRRLHEHTHHPGRRVRGGEPLPRAPPPTTPATR